MKLDQRLNGSENLVQFNQAEKLSIRTRKGKTQTKFRLFYLLNSPFSWGLNTTRNFPSSYWSLKHLTGIYYAYIDTNCALRKLKILKIKKLPKNWNFTETFLEIYCSVVTLEILPAIESSNKCNKFHSDSNRMVNRLKLK